MAEQLTGLKRLSYASKGASVLAVACFTSYEVGAEQPSPADTTLNWIYQNCSGGAVDAFPGPGTVFKLPPSAVARVLRISQVVPPKQQLAELATIDSPLEHALEAGNTQVALRLVTAGKNQPAAYSQTLEDELARFQNVIIDLAQSPVGFGITEITGGGGQIVDADVQVYGGLQSCP